MNQDPLNPPTPPKVYMYMRDGNPEQLKELTRHQQQKLCKQVFSSFPEGLKKAAKEETR